jgi:O-antigen/teichoic acid export membrane protein
MLFRFVESTKSSPEPPDPTDVTNITDVMNVTGMVEQTPESDNKSDSNQNLAGNFVTTMITQILTWAMAFGVNLYVPKLIGKERYGLLGAAMGLVAMLSVLVGFGTSNVLTREVALRPERASRLLSLTLGLRFVLGVTFFAIIALIVPLFPSDRVPAVGLLLASLVAATAILLGEAFATTLRALGNVRAYNIATLIEKICVGVVMMYLAYSQAPLWMLAGAPLLASLITLPYYTLTLRKTLGIGIATPPALSAPLTPSLGQDGKSLLVQGWPFLGWSFFTALYGQTDSLIMKWVFTTPIPNPNPSKILEKFTLGDFYAGNYERAFSLIKTTMFFPTALLMVLLPMLSRLFVENKQEFQVWAQRTVLFNALAAVPLMVLIGLGGRDLMILTGQIDEFPDAVSVFQWGGVGVFFFFLAAGLGTGVLASGGGEGDVPCRDDRPVFWHPRLYYRSPPDT